MRIALLAIGTLGDVRPFVALGAGLRAAGHAVRLAAPGDFAALAAEHQLEFRPFGESFSRFVASAEGAETLGLLRSPLRALAHAHRLLRGAPLALAHECARACAGADAVVANPIAAVLAGPVARARRAPFAVGYMFPVVPTRRHAHPLFPQWPLGGLYNRLTFALARRLVAQRDPLHARQAVRLRLVAVSPSAFERPDDWPADTHLTGYWFAPERAPSPPPALARFLAEGPAPLCIGFGSMPDAAPQRLERIVLETVRRLGARAVVVRGQGGIFRDPPPGEILVLDAADYDWLLARVGAAIHHGGAGTTAACLRAGVPQVIVPYGIDQPFWGERMRRLGVGADCIARQGLDAARLARAAGRALHDSAMRSRASALAQRIRAEDGVARAVEIIEARLAHGERR